MENKKIKILWISDIHYSEGYSKSAKVSSFFNSFFSEIKILKSEITHVVFSGDISSSATHNSYTEFNQVFVERLTKLLPNSVFLCVPGNHDVSWDKVSKMYHQKIKDGKDIFNRNSKIINDIINEDEFRAIYEPFNSLSNGLRSICGKNINAKYKEINPDLHYGYLYDRKSNVLFILINSTWFSFGDVPSETKIDDITTNLIPEGIKNTLNNIVSIDNKTLVEAGNQTYAFNLIIEKYGEKISEIIKRSRPFVISVTHHPPSWIHWSERFPSSNKNDSPIAKLFEWSNLHMVGHEHNSPTIANILGGSCLMINTGMFLDDNVETSLAGNQGIANEQYFPNNWFSIIGINNNELVHQCISYEHIRDEKFEWKEIKKYSYLYDDEDNYISYLKDKEIKEEPFDANLNFKIPLSDDSIKIKNRPENFEIIDFINYIDYANEENEIKIWVLDDSITKENYNFMCFRNKKQNHKLRFYIGSLDQNIKDKDKLEQLLNNLYCVCSNGKNAVSDIYISIVDFISLKKGMNKEDQKRQIEKFSEQREIIFNSLKIDFFECLSTKKYECLYLLLNAKFTYNIVDIGLHHRNN